MKEAATSAASTLADIGTHFGSGLTRALYFGRAILSSKTQIGAPLRVEKANTQTGTRNFPAFLSGASRAGCVSGKTVDGETVRDIYRGRASSTIAGTPPGYSSHATTVTPFILSIVG
jgi:hypothetical protein